LFVFLIFKKLLRAF